MGSDDSWILEKEYIYIYICIHTYNTHVMSCIVIMNNQQYAGSVISAEDPNIEPQDMLYGVLLFSEKAK